MPYAILRFQKRKAGGVSAIERHNERKKEAYKSNPDIDLARIKDNYHLVRPPSTYRKEINRMIDYYGAAEPLVRSGESHPSGKAEPPLWCEINSLSSFVNHTFPSWRACLPDS